jgi:hypothetical protein
MKKLVTAIAIALLGGCAFEEAPDGASSAENYLTSAANLVAWGISSTEIGLRWTDNSGDEAGTVIECSPSSTFFPYVKIATVGPNITSYVDRVQCSSLFFPTKTFWYRVRPYNAAATAASSNIAMATLGVTLPPTAPTGFTAAAASSSQIRLAWTDTSSSESGFEIERALAGGTIYTRITTAPAGTTSFVDTNLRDRTTYSYRLRAINAVGASPSIYGSASTLASDVPNAPNPVVASTVLSNAVTLKWADNSTNETWFVVERAADPFFFLGIEVVGTVAADVTSFTDKTVSPSHSYVYRVTGINARGKGTASSPLAVATASGVPASPTAVVATTVSSTQIDLRWADASYNEGGFAIECGPSDGRSVLFWGTLATVGPNATSYSDRTQCPMPLFPTRAYAYRIRATSAYGSSAPSNTVIATLASP